MKLFKRTCLLLLFVEILLAIAHILWPEYRWGQGRRSYFHFDNSLTLASWLASIQLFTCALLSLVGLHRERPIKTQAIFSGIFWSFAALIGLLLSFAEITRIHYRLNLWGFASSDVYTQLVLTTFGFIVLIIFASFFLHQLSTRPLNKSVCIGWIFAWSVVLLLTFTGKATTLFPAQFALYTSLITGFAYLAGCTLLLYTIGQIVLPPRLEALATQRRDIPQQSLELTYKQQVLLYIGVGGMTFTIIFLQIILFRFLIIFGDYLTASSVISIALLGITGGGLIAYFTAYRAPITTILCTSFLLPLAILLAFGTTVKLMDTPFLASLLLMMPFIFAGTVISIALTHAKSHVVYCIDLLGAAIGALLIGAAFSYFREESSLLFLSVFTLLVAGCLTASLASKRAKTSLISVIVVGSLSLGTLGWLNLNNDWLNVVRVKVAERYNSSEVLFSRSSFMGRYDIIRRSPRHRSVATFENGRITDNIRKRPVSFYQIDPRVPHTLMKDPTILILGLSGDGITKTSRSLGKKVYGVEINPVVANLQRNELIPYNANSYKDIDVSVIDARSYIHQSDKQYDMITLMNAHKARGRTAGRSPSHEYLNTVEAIQAYLQHLTNRGVLNIEEPVSKPRREPPVWKLVHTMRQALISNGNHHPEQHFFIFQWRTKSNNYIQILMKKTPYTPAEITNLRKWLHDVDNIKAIEAQVGKRMGPIKSRTTVLYSPDDHYDTTYAKIIKGQASSHFIKARNLQITTDDRPFHFDVNPKHPEIKKAYTRTFLLTLFLLPFILAFLWNTRKNTISPIPHMLIVALTGLGYLLVEVVLIERFEIFLGSPVITFATIIATLLLFSGLGSLWSGVINQRGVYLAIAAIMTLLLAHTFLVPSLFPIASAIALPWKVLLTIITLIPLGFFMGVPFPYILRGGQAQFTRSTAAFLFAVNAAASALAVPLAINISTTYGLHTTFITGILAYFLVGVSLFFMVGQKGQLLSRIVPGLALMLLLLWPWHNQPIAFDSAKKTNTYKVYAVNYGQSYFKSNKVFKDTTSYSKVPFGWYFWIIKGNGKTILVDTGFSDPRLVRRWNIHNFVNPLERLRQLNIPPESVTDVIVTHSHWDHIGNLAAFNRAKVWIQQSEFRHAQHSVLMGQHSKNGILYNDVQELNRIEHQGRLHIVDGTASVVAGVTVHYAGGHTPGAQFVTVNTLDGNVVLLSDNSYMYQNNRKHIPIGTAANHDENLQAIHRAQKIAASPFYIIPGHDPLVMRWFPKIADGIVHITSVPE